jgi:uncharacterized protein with PQ loop repeat
MVVKVSNAVKLILFVIISLFVLGGLDIVLNFIMYYQLPPILQEKQDYKGALIVGIIFGIALFCLGFYAMIRTFNMIRRQENI